MASTDIVTKRIHVGGLTPSITPAHIKDRFKSFGNVLEVEELGIDGLGHPRPFTFFTIQTTPSQLKKCLNIMSGSMWRGCQLRLAEAKPRYETRLEKERNPSKEAVEERLRKRKRRVLTARGPDTGKEAQDMRVPDDTTYKTKKFWAMDNEGHLIRPIAMRPSHSLPPTAIASSSKDKDGARGRGAPIRRSRIRVINPSLWHPSHLAETDFGEVSEGGGVAQDGWVFENDEEGGEDEEGRILIGRWMNPGGHENDVEEVWIQGRRAQGVIPVEEEEEDETASDETLDPTTRDRSASPLFASRGPARSASPLFPGRQAAATIADTATDSDDDKSVSDAALFGATDASNTAAVERRSASPLFPSRRAATPQIIPAEDETVKPVAPSKDLQRATSSKTTNDVAPDPQREAAKAERSRDLGFLAAFLGEEVSTADKPTKGEWAGFDEDDDEDEEDIAPLRLRGGRADSEDEDEDEDMSDSSSSDSSDDSSSDDDSDDADESAPVSKPAPPKAEVAVASSQPKPQSSLKAMFAPAPTQSAFSLLGALDADIELDEELDIPLAPPPIHRALQPEPELQPLTQSKKSHFDPDPNIPLFFPSFGKGGKDTMREDTEKEGYQGFWRHGTDEEMKEIWEKDKVELTRDWKKRYREGRKQKKRRGGVNEVD